MYSDEFEEAFGDFLDRWEYDLAESALFGIIRIAFIAGWRAAKGDMPLAQPQPQQPLRVVRGKAAPRGPGLRK